jgi:hypothetical protein
VHKIVIGGVTAAFLTSAAFGTAVFAGGNGAQKSDLASASGDMSNCQENDGTGTNGWAILNAPGQPTAVKFLNGEVHLVGGTPGTTYQIDIGMDTSGKCMATTDSLTTNTAGIGNGHIDIPTGTAGSYFIALFDSSNMHEQYASGPLTVS